MPMEQPLLLLLLALAILVSRPEDKIHDEDLVGDDEGDEEDGLVLGLVLETVDEDEDEVGVVDDLSEHDGLVEQQFRLVGLGVADERAVEVRQHDHGGVETAPRVGDVDGGCFFPLALVRVRSGRAAEDIEEEDDDGDDQGPGDDELELRADEEDAEHALGLMLPQDLQAHAQHHAADADPLERLHLVVDVELVPGEVVQEAAQQEQAHLQPLQEDLQIGPHLANNQYSLSNQIPPSKETVTKMTVISSTPAPPPLTR